MIAKLKQFLDFICEMGHLGKIRHEGLRYAGIPDPETVAAHSLRVAQIAYVLGVMEKFENPDLLVTMAVFHDMGEARTGDLHKVGARYVERNERLAVRDQVAELPELASLADYFDQTENLDTVAGVIVKDADHLEQAFSAKEYMECGYSVCENWLYNAKNKLQTESAKSLCELLTTSSTFDWWQNLKKLD